MTLTTDDLKLAFEFDAAVKSNYAAQADNDILILLDGLLAHQIIYICSLIIHFSVAEPGDG